MKLGRITAGLLLNLAASARLPEPPKQHEPWVAPKDGAVPDFVIEVSKQLFEVGWPIREVVNIGK